jgi:hypothetical protein
VKKTNQQHHDDHRLHLHSDALKNSGQTDKKIQRQKSHLYNKYMFKACAS